MTTKSKSSKAKSKSNTPKKTNVGTTAFDAALAYFHEASPSPADRRKELLAQVAGSIAGDIISAPPSKASESSMAASIATIAVDIAEEILKKAGIPAIEAGTKTMGNSEVEAAS